MAKATETQHFETVAEWKSAGSPEGTETFSVTIGRTPPTPTPEPTLAPEPTPEPEPVPFTLEQREKELREAIELSERVERGEVPSGLGLEEEYGAEYLKSVEDVKAKYEMLQQAKQVEKSYAEAGVSLTPEAEQYIEQVRAIAASPVSSFIQISPEGKIEIITRLTTPEKVGVPLSKFEKVGFDVEELEDIKRQQIIADELSKYPDLSAAVRAGKIGLLREAINRGMIPRLTVIEAQIIAADTELRRQSLERLTDFVDPATGDLALGEAIEAGVDVSVLRNAGFDRVLTEEGAKKLQAGEELTDEDYQYFTNDIYNQIKTGIVNQKEAQVLGETVESLQHYIDTHIQDDDLISLLEKAGLDSISLQSAKNYVDIVKQTLEGLEKQSKQTQLYVIANALGFSKRQKMAKLDNPLVGLSVGERNEVLEKYLELNKPLDEMRRESLILLKDQWI